MVRARCSYLPVSLSIFTLFVRLILGILIVVFFQCMTALLNPVARERQGIKWGPLSYTVVMFSLATVYTATKLNVQSVSFIDNREFPGIDGSIAPGPLGYLWSNSRALCTVPNLMFLMSNWLADGLMVGSLFNVVRVRVSNTYFPSSSTVVTWFTPRTPGSSSSPSLCTLPLQARIWVLHEPAFWADVINIATGIMFFYRTWIPDATDWKSLNLRFSIPYFSISISLNILLTLMIIIRLVLHTRNTRTTATALVGVSGLYRTVITMLVESSALYAVSSLLVIGTYISGTCSADLFLPILAETQVCAFTWSQYLDRLSDVNTDWIGHRSTPHHQASRQPKRVDEQHHSHRTYWLFQGRGSKGVEGRWRHSPQCVPHGFGG